MKKEKLRLCLLCLMVMMAVRGLAQTTYTVVPSETGKPTTSHYIEYNGEKWYAEANGTYIKSLAKVNGDEVTFYFVKSEGTFNYAIKA